MKYKAIIEPEIRDTIEIIESTIKGIDINTISKDEVKNKLFNIKQKLKKIANTISLEHDDI